jgi:hypothetical protein
MANSAISRKKPFSLSCHSTPTLNIRKNQRNKLYAGVPSSGRLVTQCYQYPICNIMYVAIKCHSKRHIGHWFFQDRSYMYSSHQCLGVLGCANPTSNLLLFAKAPEIDMNKMPGEQNGQKSHLFMSTNCWCSIVLGILLKTVCIVISMNIWDMVPSYTCRRILWA